MPVFNGPGWPELTISPRDLVEWAGGAEDGSFRNGAGRHVGLHNLDLKLQLKTDAISAGAGSGAVFDLGCGLEIDIYDTPPPPAARRRIRALGAHADRIAESHCTERRHFMTGQSSSISSVDRGDHRPWR